MLNGGGIMKLKLSIIALMLSAQPLICAGLNAAIEAQENSTAQLCPLLIRNTSASPIWLSQDPTLNGKLTFDDLEQSSAQIIQPYEIAPMNAKTTFTIFTRSPQSNTNYQRGFTVIQRLCDPSSDEYVIDFSSLESGQADHTRFIVINHTKEKEIPESAYPICPGGLLPELDEETEQWFCKVYRYSDVYEKYVDEYVPVLSYIYQWLPSSIWTQWYIKHPQFYNWYHRNPDFYSHLPTYQAPWQTKEYATWYNAQPEKIRNAVRAPEPTEPVTHEATPSSGCPLGLPECKIKTKARAAKAQAAQPAHNKTTTPPITVHSKELKKQELEDIISSNASELQSEVNHEIRKAKQKEQVAFVQKLKYYDRSIKGAKKPMAMAKPGAITTHYGKQKIIL